MDAGRYLRALVGRLVADGADAGPEAFAQCGSLVVALAEHEDPWFTDVGAVVTSRSPDVTEVTVDEARSMFPPLGPLWRALFSPGAARVDGRALAQSVRGAATGRGVRLLSMEAVGVDRSGDRVTAVRGVDDVVPCGALVLAGGAWSAAAARWVGAELPVTSTKGQIVHVIAPDAEQSDRWPIVSPILNFYLVPWPGGRVACGGTFEPEAGFDVRPTAAGVRDLLRECVAIAPGLADATVHEVRVGLRPTSVDDRPVLGPVPGTDNGTCAPVTAPTGCSSVPIPDPWSQPRAIGDVPAELALPGGALPHALTWRRLAVGSPPAHAERSVGPPIDNPGRGQRLMLAHYAEPRPLSRHTPDARRPPCSSPRGPDAPPSDVPRPTRRGPTSPAGRCSTRSPRPVGFAARDWCGRRASSSWCWSSACSGRGAGRVTPDDTSRRVTTPRSCRVPATRASTRTGMATDEPSPSPLVVTCTSRPALTSATGSPRTRPRHSGRRCARAPVGGGPVDRRTSSRH